MILRGKRGRLEDKAAWIVTEALQTVLEIRPTAVLAVVGGGSVRGIFRRLADHGLEWPRVHLFMADERLVAPQHPESNFRLAAETLGDSVPKSSLHPFPYDPSLEDCGLSRYQLELEVLGGGFDVVLVSSGQDGHIASLFPRHPTLRAISRKYILVPDAPLPPPGRITASPEMIAASQVGVVLFFGSAKMQAFNSFLDPGVTVEDCPAKLIGRMDQHYVLTDLEVNR